MLIHNTTNTIRVSLEEASDRCCIEANGHRWEWQSGFTPYLETAAGRLHFSSEFHISRRLMQTGIGSGILSQYEEEITQTGKSPICFETWIWIEEASNQIFFEWIPISEPEGTIRQVCWPGPMEFSDGKDSSYTLLNDRQGLYLPNSWPVPVNQLDFNGLFLTAGSYLPWFSQIADRQGYLALAVTPWNAGVTVCHPAGGPGTTVGIYWEPSLGTMSYRRILRYTFAQNCDYNTMCKLYRSYLLEQGQLRTLQEKAVQLPSLHALIGCPIVHMTTKNHVNPQSRFFDPEHPGKNERLIPFSQTKRRIQELHEQGAPRLYLHLDGWGQPGYDNGHPDYLPVCEEAGGYDGMLELISYLHQMGDLFAIHDQYRDYYQEASSYSPDFACMAADHSLPGHALWAGGPQNYLCATQAPYYVRRNFEQLRSHGITPDGAYLDVFTCNEGDECFHPRHRMSRRECYEFRGQCFQYLISRGILPSSEEAAGWAMDSLVLCHYAPYSFMLQKPGAPRKGLPVPLFNLVYHDCLIQPWMTDHYEGEEDYLLYALLNGGAPYLVRDGAYPGTDGAFSGGRSFSSREQIARCQPVCELHQQVALCEMIRHEFLTTETSPTPWSLQRTTFSDGTQVTVDFSRGTYSIERKRSSPGAETVDKT